MADCRNSNLVKLIVLLITALLVAVPNLARAEAVKLDLSRVTDSLHLEFSGQKEWIYDLKSVGDGSTKVVLRIAPLRPEAVLALKSHKDALVEGITVNEQAIDGKTEVTFKIGKQTDFFDYFTDQPSKLIIDFFPKELAAKAEAAAKPEAKPETKPEAKSDAKPLVGKLPAKKANRDPAGGDFVLVAKNEVPKVPEKVDVPHGIFDGGDPNFARFSIKDYEIRPEAVSQSHGNFYLPFPMLDLGTPQLRAMIMTPPTYEIVPTEGRENQEARVVLGLFKENKPGLLMKTAEEFLAAYPESQYSEIVRYLIADTHYNIWRTEKSYDDFETAMNLYLKLTETYPKSPMTPRSLLLMGYSYITRGDSFAAIKAFQHFARVSPKSKHLDQTMIATASAYLLLNRFDDAYAMLEQIEKNGATANGREEAAYRKGDVYFRKKDYARAITEYAGAAKRFPAAAGRFPNASYNTAEAQFNTEAYRESLESYGKFVKNFPDNAHGGFALTRVGELLGILGAEPKRAEGAYFESFFRYRATPGAGVARIRMLASRMPSMKEKELGNAINEMRAIAKRYENRPLSEKDRKEQDAQKIAEAKESEKAAEGGHEKPKAEGEAKSESKGEHGVAKSEKKEPGFKVAADPDDDATQKVPELPGIEEFTALVIADGYTGRDEFETAAKQLIAYFQKNPNSTNRDRILGRIQQNMTESIHASVETGSFLDALRRYSRESGGWLKNTDRLDLSYYVGRAYEQAGVFAEAEAFYKTTLKSLQTRGAKADLPIHEKTPSTESLELRLASVAAKENNFAGAEAELKLIKETSKLSEPEQIEYAEVAADVSEARGQTSAAKKYLSDLIKTWKGDPRLTASLHLRIARIDAKSKDFKDADLHLAKIAEYFANGDYMPDDVHAQSLELKGDLDLARGKRKDAAKAYQALLDTYEAKRPLSSVRYRLGQIQNEDGNLKLAEKTWSELKPDRDSLWFRLASDEMKGAKWQQEYKKYLNRIPAAAAMR